MVGIFPSLSVPLMFGSTLLSSQLRIAKPTPYSLLSVSGLPWKNILKSFSWMCPLPASLVSWRAQMSTFSRRSSSLMIAVFLLSSIFLRSSPRPGCMVLTFHVPTLSSTPCLDGGTLPLFFLPVVFCRDPCSLICPLDRARRPPSALSGPLEAGGPAL